MKNKDTFESIADSILKTKTNLGMAEIERSFCHYMQRIMNIGGAHSLINDDDGHWAIAADGNHTSFIIEKKYFANSIGGALVKWANEMFKRRK